MGGQSAIQRRIDNSGGVMHSLVSLERLLDNIKRVSGLGLYPPQSFRLDVFLKERFDASTQFGADRSE